MWEGPCPREVHLGGMTVAEKKEFEVRVVSPWSVRVPKLSCMRICKVACDANWPEGPAMCVRDYAAACPLGWRTARGRHGDVECLAPPGYVCFVSRVGVVCSGRLCVSVTPDAALCNSLRP